MRNRARPCTVFDAALADFPGGRLCASCSDESLGSGYAGFSASTSSAGLSSRKPLNAAWRTMPSPVQPANSISATSPASPSELAWPVAARWCPRTDFLSDSCSLMRGKMRDDRFVLKPVPTRPI